ncbi:MAG: PRD domain-containing protein [Vallitaleaceae bacterium]|nr:PRD domain-containing protein [Vallitaleaceae bacterium]
MIQNKIDQVILDFIDMRNMGLAKKLLSHIEQQMGYQIADNSFIALILRLSVTIARCQQEIYISGAVDNTQKVKSEKIYSLVNEWFQDQPLLKMNEAPEEEICYLAVHIKGAKLRETFSHNKISMTEDYKTIKLAKEIIYTAEKETGIYLEDNEKLLICLVRHLRPAIYRMKMRLDIMNPLLEDIKSMYPQLFEATRKCAYVIEDKEHVKVPEDEIAYLATHIGAAIKSEKRNLRKNFRAVVACTNGIGASQLLVTEIEKEFPDIQIVEIISTIDMDERKLSQKHIDLIITTVAMPYTTLPTILVNTILGESDRKKIKDVLANFLPENISYEKVKNMHLKDKLKSLKIYSDFIIQVLENYSFVEEVELADVSELIQFISRSIAITAANRMELENAFKDREEKGSTILGQKGMMLLHCRSKAAQQLHVMVVRTKDTMAIKNSRGETTKVSTVIAMVAPISISSHALEVLSEITRKIITSDFSATLRLGSQDEIYMGISSILDQFIQCQVSNMK